MKKRLLNLFMALVMMVCVLPMAASAATNPWCLIDGHTWNNGKCDVCSVTCNHDAYVDGVCTTCGFICEHKTTVTIPAVAPQCGVAGSTEGKKCSACETILETPKVVSGLLHDYSVFVEDVSEATCTQKAVKKYRCRNCTSSSTLNKEVGEPLPHNLKSEVLAESTCTTNGMKKTWCTNNCNQATKYETIYAPGHSEVDIEPTAATCTKKATEGGKMCTVCKETTVEPVETGSLAEHQFELLGYADGYTPTCTTGGKNRYQCSVCKGYKHENCDPLPHNLTSEVLVEATCNTTGSKKTWCTNNCNQATTYETIPVLGHDEVVEVFREATCTQTGCIKTTCSRCNALYVLKEIPVLDHTVEILPAIDPTCTATGLTAGEKCSVCGEILTEQTVIAKIPHAWKTVEAQDPTCKADGYNEHEACTECGETDGKTVIAAGAAYHEFENFKCKHCGTYDPSHQHEGTGVITTESTCTAEGVKTFECDDCDHTWTEAVAKKPHTYNAKARCTECGAQDPAHEHNYVQTAYRAPTCTVEGKVTQKCSVCDDQTETLIDAIGHSYEDGKCVGCGITAACEHANTTTTVASKATCSSAGEKVTICDDCGKTVDTKVIPATGKHTYVNNRCTGCGKNNPNRITTDFQDVFIVG